MYQLRIMSHLVHIETTNVYQWLVLLVLLVLFGHVKRNLCTDFLETLPTPKLIFNLQL